MADADGGRSKGVDAPSSSSVQRRGAPAADHLAGAVEDARSGLPSARTAPSAPGSPLSLTDSQSAKTTERGGPRGFDGKKVNGLKRHIPVDTLGLLLKVVHPVNLHDRGGGRLLGEAVENCQSWQSQGDTGQFRQWASQELDLEFEVVSPWWRHLPA